MNVFEYCEKGDSIGLKLHLTSSSSSSPSSSTLSSSEIETQLNFQREGTKETPLIYACLHGQTQIVNILVNDSRVDVNLGDKYDSPPLYFACWNGTLEIVNLLLNNKKLDVNKRNEDGKTALMMASLRGFVNIVRVLLLRQDIDVFVTDKFGKSTLDYANDGYSKKERLESQENLKGKVVNFQKVIDLLNDFLVYPEKVRRLNSEGKFFFFFFFFQKEKKKKKKEN